MRQLLFDGKYSEAQAVASRDMMLHPRATPASYQTLGRSAAGLRAGDQAEGYRRSLDLDTGIARVEYTIFGVKYTREVFAWRQGGGRTAGAGDADRGGQAGGSQLRDPAGARGKRHHRVRGRSRDHARTGAERGRAVRGGTRRCAPRAAESARRDEGLQVERATAATIWLVAATNYQLDAPGFKGADPSRLAGRARLPSRR